ncbi:hypothetical protein LTR37_000921 [Vermiconidia calcicola]|uniref:Uncharacterized protein n=1 Tax=Vermiconidia calcicola TaxID=1690605 RepID=A0ACC3NXK5_9PEZI|nr:hypothetical protein LTR37_000921 [Vermiconidia calcicola]
MPLNRTPGHPDPTAAKPTQGFAWAFPDTVPEERRDSESGESSIGHGVSRTNSFAASSVRSSIFSTDSHLPTGQNRFDDAIDYIRSCQHQEQRLQHEVGRLQRDMEYSRDAQKENDMLKTEVQVMHQHLRRLDPSNPHVYGHFTSQLSQQAPGQQAPQTNGTSGIALPPLNPPGSSGGHPNHQPAYTSGPPPGAMQGIEYGYGAR